MKKLGFLLSVCVMVCVVMISENCFADLAALTESEMKQATAQAGIVISASDRVDFDIGFGTLAYGDEDGTDGTPGYISLNDVYMKGHAQFSEPVSIDISTTQNEVSGMMVNGIDISVKKTEIFMEQFDIGSITVGSEPGAGKSFGSISIRDFHTIISGNVRIATR